MIFSNDDLLIILNRINLEIWSSEIKIVLIKAIEQIDYRFLNEPIIGF